jgi:hypothetical protein
VGREGLEPPILSERIYSAVHIPACGPTRNLAGQTGIEPVIFRLTGGRFTAQLLAKNIRENTERLRLRLSLCAFGLRTLVIAGQGYKSIH